MESCRSGLVELLLKASVSLPLLHNVNKSGKKSSVRRGARSRAAFLVAVQRSKDYRTGESMKMRVFISCTGFNGKILFLLSLSGKTIVIIDCVKNYIYLRIVHIQGVHK